MNSDPLVDLCLESRHQLALPQLRALLESLARAKTGPGSATRLDTEIHPDCQMLAHSLRHHRHAGLSVSQYYAVALQQLHAARAFMECLGKAPETIHFLDFACGYGRLLRFLAHDRRLMQIAAAEIQPRALDWVRERYNVKTLRSTADPAEFRSNDRFDLVWVVSLFSHLPDRLFRSWLGKLAELRASGGMVMFTVHDEALLSPDTKIPESGMLYMDVSENADLGSDIYGTSFVTENYVREAAQSAVPELELVRLPRLMGFEQDAYVLAEPDHPGFEFLAGIRHGMRGWLDEMADSGNAVKISGWAASMDDDRGVSLQVLLDGEPLLCNTGEARPRVAEALGRPALERCGWSLTIDKKDLDRTRYLSIIATNKADPPALIYAAPIGPDFTSIPVTPG